MMKIWLDGLTTEYRKSLDDLIRLFFPDPEIKLGQPSVTTEETAGLLKVWEEEVNGYLAIEAEFLYISQHGRQLAAHQREVLTDPHGEDAANRRRRVLRLCVLKALAAATGKPAGPWGILTGIRPTKVVHRLIDAGCPAEEIEEILTEDYAVSPAKARLLDEVARRQRPFLLSPRQAERLVSVYIGIPFCPSRCLYCSFPGYPLSRHRAWVDPFLAALTREITAIGAAIREKGGTVQTIYLGGGTPTSLETEKLARLMETINQCLVSPSTTEITVEGGRPETLSTEKLNCLRKLGVNRLSINPQTMRDETLRTIGRSHTADDIVQAVARARQAGFPILNMDVIIGLPGETADIVQETMEQIGRLRPENLTVHTMAVKRASRLKEEYNAWTLPEEAEVGRMLEVTRAAAADLDLVPYYLYRQKQILANLENVGYCRQGSECVYNIQVMEERQTIIGLGAGAGSKWVNPADWTLLNTYNPKDPHYYLERINELIARKIELLIQGKIILADQGKKDYIINSN